MANQVNIAHGTLVRVHAMSGVDSRVVTAECALATLADMTGHDVDSLHNVRGAWIQLWTFRCAGAIVGRIEVI